MSKYISRVNKGKMEYLVNVSHTNVITDELIMQIAKDIEKKREELIQNGFVKGDNHD